MHPHRDTARASLFRLSIHFATFMALLAAGLALPAFAAAEPPGVGDTLPQLEIVAPCQKADAEYLGVGEQSAFPLLDIQSDFVLLELVGVYCPYCHKQAPLFNSLFKRLERSGLGDRVKMLALASGATAPEVVQLRKHSKYEYPVLRDENFSVHKALNEPKTPFTLVVNKDGEILFAKLGVIEDIDAFFATIQKIVE